MLGADAYLFSKLKSLSLLVQKAANLVLILATQNAAGRIHKKSARLECCGIIAQNSILNFSGTVQMLGLELPLGVHIAAYDPGSAAGYVKQHFVGPSSMTLHVNGRADYFGAHSLDSCPEGALLGFAELVGFDVHA